ncbi:MULTISPECIES: radical SAM protein [Flavobacterium]|uniref:Radical SAM protein n=2 Tax=Flavobacterium TaxID=237 RepID=A0AA94F4F2_9FLAO|nr:MULTISPECIES: radical SAM protein [Flavobacterium]AMA49026.1 radical SAM protein [Flavobacterium covae]MCH4830956.1 radical SAM protein [Flavobacterium columnare]MCH4833103.1 radical SAM protein [Flavobacterium columnare]MCJ1806939.1 radical SAM protein [Flavobacterium covae]MCJ1809746.1 radical SAM protein [Flavobacterium covae]
MPTRDYIYYDATQSICPECLHLCNAKIVFKDEKVWMLKHCKTHGDSRVMIADDIEYYRQIRNYNKQSEVPLKFNTKLHYGCPYDCGLCPDHEQHSCLSIVEVTDRCNLACPTCYASSAPNYGNHRQLDEIEKMLDAIVANEGEPDVVQISGGEPTVHPQFFEILDLAKSKPIKHLMVNTNGIRIAKDISFVEKLASYMPDFEIYLQFDSFKPEVLEKMRGEDLSEIRKKAIENLNQFNLSTTLVVTLQKGENDDEIGKILEYALQQKSVRGVTFQPTQVAGRNENYDDNQGRITLTEVRRKIYEQYPVFTPQDLIPVPCNPDALCMAYALKMNGEVFPMTNLINPEDLLNNSKNTIVFESDEKLKNHLLTLFSTGISVDCAEEELGELMCCLPRVKSDHLQYDNLFRIIIMNFMDAHDFDVRAVKKSCVHIVDKKGKLIPFETMNLFYRDESIKEIRKQLN